jgi:pSer/pThr/pTyr-binding forkhead associated (FHA) protein
LLSVLFSRADVSDGLRSFLRFGSQMIELDQQPLLIGRGGACDIVVDDELCSREHCRLQVRGDTIFLTDLGSVNGVLVNGERIDGEVPLRHGDTLAVGREQFIVVRLRRAPRDAKMRSSAPPMNESTDTKRASIHDILLGGARKALDNRDIPNAEQGAGSLFVTLRSHAVRGTGGVTKSTLLDAIDLGIELAGASGSSSWLDQALDLATAGAVVLDRNTIERICATARRVGKPKRTAEDYIRMCQRVAPNNNAALPLRNLPE